jgi:hypothetical protein
MTSMTLLQRLVNQQSWFLCQLPRDPYEHRVVDNMFDDAFNRSIYRLPLEVVRNYLETRHLSGNNTSMFPENDRLLQWVERNRNERMQSIQENRLGRNDLGISISQYFPELDGLYV